MSKSEKKIPIEKSSSERLLKTAFDSLTEGQSKDNPSQLKNKPQIAEFLFLNTNLNKSSLPVIKLRIFLVNLRNKEIYSQIIKLERDVCIHKNTKVSKSRKKQKY